MYGWSRHRELGLLLVAVVLAGCGRGDSSAPSASIGTQDGTPASTASSAGRSSASSSSSAEAAKPTFRLPIVVIETSLGDIKVRLRDDKSPRTVENFLENYVGRGFYDQTIIHHVEAGFMVAAGGYAADLEPRPTRAWIRNESNNELSNKRGTMAMARHPDYPHSATSQFFFNVVDNPSLDYRKPADGAASDDAYGYCVFGEVIEGLDVVEKIAKCQVHATAMFPSIPVETILIKSIRVAGEGHP
jgi:peptidyl-prolyl cis-trans isomerase A (cyclophilin A)